MAYLSAGEFVALPCELTAFAWSAPMRDLAELIGISDVGLKKLLRQNGVIAPPQGYWNKKHAGKPLPSPPKPPARRPGETGRILLDERFKGLVAEADPMPQCGPFVSRHVPEGLDELKAGELKAIGRVTVPRLLSNPHVGLRTLLAKDEKLRKKHEKSGYDWYKLELDGPLAQRKLRILDTLFKALERRECSGRVLSSHYDNSIQCDVGQMTVEIALELAGPKRLSRRTQPVSANGDLPDSTPLKLLLKDSRDAAHSVWEDQSGNPLEKQIADIAAETITSGEALFRKSLVKAPDWNEERARIELRQIQEKRAAMMQKRVADLRISGELMREANDLRALVSQFYAASKSGADGVISDEKLERWKAWALEQADLIDPIKSGQVSSHLYIPELDD